MAIPTLNTDLSANDKRILDALFDPETLPSSVERSKDASIIDNSLPPHPTLTSAQLSMLENQQNELIRQTSDSTASAIENAIVQEDAIVRNYSNYPSAYVNRAMLRRMKLEASLQKEASLFDGPESDVECLFTDLSRAIHLSLPESSPADPVSPYQARILRTAYSHRAYLYLKAAETNARLKGQSKSELEELASADFASAAKFGDEVAREMSVRTNPYAKMCGAIVRNALREERNMAQ